MAVQSFPARSHPLTLSLRERKRFLLPTQEPDCRLREAGIRLPILVLGSLQPGAANVVVQFDKLLEEAKKMIEATEKDNRERYVDW